MEPVLTFVLTRQTIRQTVAVCALAGALLAHPAAAQEQPLTLRLGTSSTWDANIFRVADSAPDPQLVRGIAGRSDRIDTINVGLRIEKAYSQQVLMVDLSQTATRYEKFGFLDHDAFQYQGSWRWHLTPRISGALTASRTENLVSFEDAGEVQRIVRVTTNRGATVDAQLFGGWHLLAGASETRTTNSQQFLAQPDTSQTGTDVGLTYEAVSGSSINVTRRSQRGTIGSQTVDLVTFVDSPFVHSESELSVRWIATGRSSLNGRLTRIARRHEQLPQRDFSGTAGELRYAWTPTGKLSLDLTATRAIVPFTAGLSSSVRVDDSLVLAPALRISDKLSLRLGVTRRVSDFRGAVAAGSGPLRRDVYRSLDVGASWSPCRSVTLGATLRRERRASTEALFNFEGTVAGVTAALSF